MNSTPNQRHHQFPHPYTAFTARHPHHRWCHRRSPLHHYSPRYEWLLRWLLHCTHPPRTRWRVTVSLPLARRVWPRRPERCPLAARVRTHSAPELSLPIYRNTQRPPLINPGHHPAKPRPCYTSSPSYRHPGVACAGWCSGWGGPWAVRACYGRPGAQENPEVDLNRWRTGMARFSHSGCMQAHVGHAGLYFPFGWLTQGMSEFWTMEPFCSLTLLVRFK